MKLSILKWLTCGSMVGLAIFMALVQHISLGFAPVMIAWNGAPLVIACAVANKLHNQAAFNFMIIFAACYIMFVGIADYEWLCRHPEAMSGFIYVLAPLPGWAIISVISLPALLISWIRNKNRVVRKP